MVEEVEVEIQRERGSDASERGVEGGSRSLSAPSAWEICRTHTAHRAPTSHGPRCWGASPPPRCRGPSALYRGWIPREM